MTVLAWQQYIQSARQNLTVLTLHLCYITAARDNSGKTTIKTKMKNYKILSNVQFTYVKNTLNLCNTRTD